MCSFKPHCACCISHDCKLDLVTLHGNLTGDQYIRDVLQPVVASHFDNHSLATRPVYMDDNARPHHSRAVTAYLQSEAVTSVPCPAMSLDLNPIEHIWDMLGRRMQIREPPVQNICQLNAASHREWQQLSHQDTRRLTGAMRRMVEAVRDLNPGSGLGKEQKSRLRFGGRRLLLLNDKTWRCHPYTQAL
jgi:transposase